MFCKRESGGEGRYDLGVYGMEEKEWKKRWMGERKTCVLSVKEKGF